VGRLDREMGCSHNLNSAIEYISKVLIAESNGLHDYLQNVVLSGIPLVVRLAKHVDVT
jgi:hypothetical protein